MTFQDVKNFNQKYIQGQTKTYVILGNEKVLDFETIEKTFGHIERVSTETYFGY